MSWGTFAAAAHPFYIIKKEKRLWVCAGPHPPPWCSVEFYCPTLPSPSCTILLSSPPSRILLRSVGRTVGRCNGRSVGRSFGRTVGPSVARTVGRSVGRSVDQTVSPMVGRVRMEGWSVGRSAGWSVLNRHRRCER